MWRLMGYLFVSHLRSWVMPGWPLCMYVFPRQLSPCFAHGKITFSDLPSPKRSPVSVSPSGFCAHSCETKRNPDICNKWTTNSEVKLIKDKEKSKHEEFCVLLYLYFWICESDKGQCACVSELLLMWANWTPLLCKAASSYGPFRGMQCLSTVFMTAMSNGKPNLYIDSIKGCVYVLASTGSQSHRLCSVFCLYI